VNRTDKGMPEALNGLQKRRWLSDYHLLLSDLGAFSLATETDMGLPSISLLLSPLMASFASASESISTNANRGCVLFSLSVITFAEDTVPNSWNNFFKLSSVGLKT
jgi:hypothetical protein